MSEERIYELEIISNEIPQTEKQRQHRLEDIELNIQGLLEEDTGRNSK